MDRTLFKNLMENEEYNGENLLGEVLDKTKNIYSNFTDEEMVKELLSIILSDLQSIKTCTKMIRDKMKDKEHSDDLEHYCEKNLGIRYKIISIEELSELMEVLTEDILTGSDHLALMEEFADATISMDYIKELMDINDESLNKAIYIKNKRILNKLNKK